MKITKGKINKPIKTLVYGPEGIGKSTFASKFPEPIFIDTEGSTSHMDVSRFEAPTSWSLLMSYVDYVIQNKPCKTLVIDTADWAEKLCAKHIIDNAGDNITSIEGFGYGKGYVYLEEEFARLLHKLNDVIEAGINVVITAHAHMRKFEQPDELGAYDRWELKMSKKVSPLVREWADMVLFANYKTLVVNVDGQGAIKGKNKVQGGQRVMFTTHHPCWDAKNRFNLPEELSFDYKEISHLFEKVLVEEQVSEPKKEEAKNVVDIKEKDIQEESDIPKNLLDLMNANDVKKYEIEKIVELKGYFPKDTPIKNYPSDFIDGVLVGAWEQVYKAIKEYRKMPF